MMKRIFWIALLMLAGIPNQGWAQPCLEMTCREYVAADPVIEGQEVQGTFWIQNTGTSELIIHQVAPACGCLASFFDSSIPPGDKGRIELKLDTRNLRGRIQKRALVVSNDPQEPKMFIKMIVEVR